MPTPTLFSKTSFILASIVLDEINAHVDYLCRYLYSVARVCDLDVHGYLDMDIFAGIVDTAYNISYTSQTPTA